MNISRQQVTRGWLGTGQDIFYINASQLGLEPGREPLRLWYEGERLGLYKGSARCVQYRSEDEFGTRLTIFWS